MPFFGRFYLDKEKDIIVELTREGERLFYVLRTPNHRSGNLITNLARLCELPLSFDEGGLKVIRGEVPCYVDGDNRRLYIFRMGNTKIANIFPDGSIEMKASVPAISKALMSQTKDYRLSVAKTIVKTYIFSDCKFRTDLHTHMSGNLEPDVLIALGIRHQIRYPLYYIRKLGLRVSEEQNRTLLRRRAEAAKAFENSGLSGKYLDRKIDDNTTINFADLILKNLGDAAYNIPRIRASLAVMKDGQAVFTNLEKVYLYRYVFTKGTRSTHPVELSGIGSIPDPDIVQTLEQMMKDSCSSDYAGNSLFQDKLLWIARQYQRKGIRYAEISDTSLLKGDRVVQVLSEIHEVMPKIYRETGVMLRFLASFRRIPLTIIRDSVQQENAEESLRILKAIACDPYVAGSDIVGEEITDIREQAPLIREIVRIAKDAPGFVIRIHAGENDSLRDNVMNSLECVTNALLPGQQMPHLRIGHGLYTADLDSRKGQKLIQKIRDCGAVLEFQITSNVRLNNLSALDRHPLKKYLHAGVMCVQGTDGGALYGTDSIDEELALERMLDLSREDLLLMKKAEDRVIEKSLEAYEEKQEMLDRRLGMGCYEAYLKREIEACRDTAFDALSLQQKERAESALSQRIRELPADKIPLVVLGGSFNNDRHHTTPRKEIIHFVKDLMEKADPEKYFFVIGHHLSGYERLILEENRGRFEIFAFVPAAVSLKEKKKILESGVSVRVSIEEAGLGLYKSVSYEIFKRRPSVLLALDGNSAGANMIQEAKNGRGSCRIYISGHSRDLRTKASSLSGYVNVFRETEGLAEQLLKEALEITEKKQ